MSEYFYDVLDLCRVVNRNMLEVENIDHLFRGLRPELIEKLWGARITTTEEFLTEAQRYQTMTNLLSHRKNMWPVAAVHCDEAVDDFKQQLAKLLS